MTKTQITKATDKLLTNRYEWLAAQCEKINPVLAEHKIGRVKIENHHKANKLQKELDRAYGEMTLIEAEMQKRHKAKAS